MDARPRAQSRKRRKEKPAPAGPDPPDVIEPDVEKMLDAEEAERTGQAIQRLPAEPLLDSVIHAEVEVEPPGRVGVDFVSVLAPVPEGYARVYRVIDAEAAGRPTRYSTPPENLSEVLGQNIDEAIAAAKLLWPGRFFSVIEKMVRGGAGQAIQRLPAEPLLDRVIHAEVDAAERAASVKAAEEKKARKAESDRKYREKQKAARALDRAVGNRVESAPVPPSLPSADDIFIAWSGINPLYAVRAASLRAATDWVRANHPRDSRIDVEADDGVYRTRKLFLQADLKAPPRSAAVTLVQPPAGTVVESGRTWEAYDLRFKPPVLMGEVKGVNSTRAIMTAEATWPNTPSRMIELREKGTCPANRLKPAEANPDRDLAGFRAEWEADLAAEKLQRSEPEPAKSRRPKREVAT